MNSENKKSKIGRYEIISKLGEGGMGVVYKALDPVLGRKVALKVGKMSEFGLSGADRTTRNKSLEEARLAANFIHPNITLIYDAGFEKDLFFMALEYIDGPGLHEFNRKPDLMPHKKLLETIFNVCFGLAYIHEKGYIHLDVKPSNIMICKSGEVKLMDFGIARFLKEESAKHDAKVTSGSPYYMSPEQIESSIDMGAQSDIFSLGVTLYELLAGDRPFKGDNAYQIFYKTLNEEPEPLRALLPDISPALEDVVSRAMEKNPKDRFQSAKDFADALLVIIKGKDSGSLDKQDKKKMDHLRRLLFFRYFEYSELAEIISVSSWTFHLKDTSICHKEQNGSDTNIYILMQGRASLQLGDDVKMLNPGDCFGESSLVYNMSRSTTVKAETDCVIMTINANILNQCTSALQVKFLKEFYRKKTTQLVEANLKLIQQKML